MDIALKQGVSVDLTKKMKDLINSCKISNLEKMFSDCLESVPCESKTLDYIGELNSNY